MKYTSQPEVHPEVALRSQRDIDAVNSYVDMVHGVVITVNYIRWGQDGPYTDSVYEAVIFCHQPNVLTTNGPLVRLISRDDALALARIFVHEFTPNGGSHGMGPRLDFIRPEPNPCGLQSNDMTGPDILAHACWRVRIVLPSTD